MSGAGLSEAPGAKVSPIHIGDFNPDEAISVVVADCGATALVLPDATLSPADFDFVDPAWPENATCEDCKRSREAKRRLEKAREVRA